MDGVTRTDPDCDDYSRIILAQEYYLFLNV